MMYFCASDLRSQLHADWETNFILWDWSIIYQVHATARTVYHGVLLSGKAAAIKELHFVLVLWAKSDNVVGLIGSCMYGGLRMRAYMVQMDTYTVARHNDIEHGRGLHVIGGSNNSKDAEG